MKIRPPRGIMNKLPPLSENPESRVYSFTRFAENSRESCRDRGEFVDSPRENADLRSPSSLLDIHSS